MTVWKFQIDREDSILIPVTHRILSVGVQDGRMMVWALVDPMSPEVHKHLTVVGTGWKGSVMDGISRKRFLGTVQLDDYLVFHIFEDEPGSIQ